jgi:hypothetical protein
MSRDNLISEQEWRDAIRDDPYEDSGKGTKIDDADDPLFDRLLQYNFGEVDILPSSAEGTTTRCPQILKNSSGRVGFTIELRSAEEVDRNFALVEALFNSIRAEFDDECEVSQDLVDALKDAMKDNSEIEMRPAEIASIIDCPSLDEFYLLTSFELPDAKRSKLESLGTELTRWFRKETLAASVEALANEYLRTIVDPEELHGLVKRVLIKLPLQPPFRFIVVPGLHEEDHRTATKSPSTLSRFWTLR